MSARRHVLRRLRSAPEVFPQPDHHAGGQPLRLPLHLGRKGIIVSKPASAALVAACFNPTYASARAAFLQAADRAQARTDVLINDRAKGPDGSTLTTDVAVLGPDSADSALVIVSGTHGPEGFVGSAAQIALLDALARDMPALPLRIVLIHAINPWGFAHISRTTENNVDLNRNFIDWDQPAPDNPLYADLHPLLTPQEWTEEVLAQANAAREAWVEKHGLDVLDRKSTR